MTHDEFWVCFLLATGVQLTIGIIYVADCHTKVGLRYSFDELNCQDVWNLINQDYFPHYIACFIIYLSFLGYIMNKRCKSLGKKKFNSNPLFIPWQAPDLRS